MYLGFAVAHLHLSPSEFYKLSLREFWCAANALNPEQEEETFKTDKPFFEDEEVAIFKDMKIIANRTNQLNGK